MKLIDADALRERLDDLPAYGDARLLQVLVMSRLEQAPTICCAECVHWETWDRGGEKYDCRILACGEEFRRANFGCVEFERRQP